MRKLLFDVFVIEDDSLDECRVSKTCALRKSNQTQTKHHQESNQKRTEGTAPT